MESRRNPQAAYWRRRGSLRDDLPHSELGLPAASLHPAAAYLLLFRRIVTASNTQQLDGQGRRRALRAHPPADWSQVGWSSLSAPAVHNPLGLCFEFCLL